MDVLAYIQSLEPAISAAILPYAGRIPALSLSSARLHQLSKGDVLVRMQDPFDRVFVLCKGSLRILTHDVSGNDFLLDQFVAPTVFGEMELLLDYKHYQGSLVATTEAEVLSLDAKAYKDWILNDSQILFERTKWLLKKLAAQSRFEQAMLSMSGNQRIMYVIYLSLKAMPKDTVATIRINQGELAERVKVSTKTVSRALDELKDKGFIKTQGRNLIIEPQMRQRLDGAMEDILAINQN